MAADTGNLASENGAGTEDSPRETPTGTSPGGPETAAVPSGPPESQCLLLPSDQKSGDR